MKVYESMLGAKRYYATADKAEIECDDDGFHLVVETDEGEKINVHIHGVAEEFLASAKETIGSWIAEREAARGTGPIRITEDDLDAYPLGDPKRVTLAREIH